MPTMHTNAFHLFEDRSPEPEEIVQFRKDYQLRQRDAAQITGVSLPTWSRWEKGDPKQRGHEMRPQLWDYFRLRVAYNHAITGKAATPEELLALPWHISTTAMDEKASSIAPVVYHLDAEAVAGIQSAAQSDVRGTTELVSTLNTGQTLTLSVAWLAQGRTDGGYRRLFEFGAPALDPFGGRLLTDMLLNDGTGDPMKQLLSQAEMVWQIARPMWGEIERRILPVLPRPLAPASLGAGGSVSLSRDDGPDVVFDGECLGHVSVEPLRSDMVLRAGGLLYQTTLGTLVCRLENYSLLTDFPCARIVQAEDADRLRALLGEGRLAEALYEKAAVAAG